MVLSRPVFIVAAKRTAFGGFGGSFKNVSAIQLGQKASAAALFDAKLDPEKVKSVIFGNVIQVDFINSSRQYPLISFISSIKSELLFSLLVILI